MQVQSVYIHIPFCKQICHYCNFVKYYYMETKADAFIDALIKEIDTAIPGKRNAFRTIYMGGGTPTALSMSQLQKLFQFLNEKFDLTACEEFTIEINPGDIDKEKAELLKYYGVNRVSFGVQVMDDEMLEKIGRMHRVKDVYSTVDILTEAKFTNISLDLIYALPNQTVAHFEKTLKAALQFQLPHYSTYALQIEPKTVFYHKRRKGVLHQPPEDDEVEMYQLLQENMRKQGVLQYEISNFAKPGYESKHNLTYWNNEYYFGFGAGAHGYLPGKRTANYKPLGTYMKEITRTGSAVEYLEKITLQDRIEEEMFLQLRKAEGIHEEVFRRRYGLSLGKLYKNELNQLIQDKLLTYNNGNYALTNRGMLLGDRVFEQFLLMENFPEKLEFARSY
ncbi:radical SAM family heme chaperone HemW [Oceanobacillus sp. J11TS1]|uniref:radical SAM family heme chaperone HemW n=1 Tax=Oceanobacillus sp. J11TS1 TaxID=2807191 RepID=UPI001B148929|nr:radical SAM family heme chaperone HemW [Oceanobacillus sp. J11TS1]GIO22074.1 oxygen-independent coproporphyrinogen-III oxidase-like protein YqeR [Oceanobacillus sp. J11TS1]